MSKTKAMQKRQGVYNQRETRELDAGYLEAAVEVIGWKPF